MTRAWLLVLAGCGAAAPAPPARPTTTASLIDALELAADRACACTTRDCAAIVEEDLQAQLAAPTPPILDDPQFARADAAIQRGVTCLWAHEIPGYAYARLADQANVALRDEICACTDLACVSSVHKRAGNRLRHLRATPSNAETEDGWDELDEAASVCEGALADRTEPVLEMIELRDRACGCPRGDRVCAETVVEAMTAWAASHPDTMVSAAENRRMRAIGVDLRACLIDAGWTG